MIGFPKINIVVPEHAADASIWFVITHMHKTALCHDCLIPVIVIQAHGFFKCKENSGKQMTLVTTKVEAKVACEIVVCPSSSLSLQCVSKSSCLVS